MRLRKLALCRDFYQDETGDPQPLELLSDLAVDHFPALLPLIFFVAILDYDLYDKATRKNAVITCTDPEGQVLTDFQRPVLPISRLTQEKTFLSSLVVELSDLPIESPGRYYFSLSIDEEELGSVGVRIWAAAE